MSFDSLFLKTDVPLPDLMKAENRWMLLEWLHSFCHIVYVHTESLLMIYVLSFLLQSSFYILVQALHILTGVFHPSCAFLPSTPPCYHYIKTVHGHCFPVPNSWTFCSSGWYDDRDI